MRVIVNTALSLNACCVSAFIFSRLLSKEGKFDMVHIQNATLAGGVAIGSSADLVGPGAAVVVGTLAGLLSVLGYVYVSDFLKSKLNLDDTCGVNNLHGMPGIAGGVIGAVATSVRTLKIYTIHVLL
jgi:ammonium transporter Rh